MPKKIVKYRAGKAPVPFESPAITAVGFAGSEGLNRLTPDWRIVEAPVGVALFASAFFIRNKRTREAAIDLGSGVLLHYGLTEFTSMPGLKRYK